MRYQQLPLIIAVNSISKCQKIMFRYLFILVFLGAFSLNAKATTVTPADCNLGVNCETAGHQFNDDVVFPQLEGLLLYKASPDDGEANSVLKDSYSTVFNSDNSAATITFDGGLPVACTDPCYLVVKDGNHQPYRYLFNLALNPFNWDGETVLELSGFWPDQGAISHVAIYGVSPIPVPAAFWLFGTALIGFVGFSRRTKV